MNKNEQSLNEVFGNKSILIQKIVIEKLKINKINCSLNQLVPEVLENGGIYLKPAYLLKRYSPRHYKDTILVLNPDYCCILISYHVFRNCSRICEKISPLQKHYSLLSEYLKKHSQRG